MTDNVIGFKGFQKIDTAEEQEAVMKEMIDEILSPDKKGYLLIRLDEDTALPEAMFGGVLDISQTISALELLKQHLSYQLLSGAAEEYV